MDRLIFGFLLVLTLTASFGNAGKTSRSSLSLNITDWSGQNKDYELLEYLSFSSRFVPTALWADNTGDYGTVDSTDLMINPQCVIDSRAYVQALWNRTEWALSSKNYLILVYSIRNTNLFDGFSHSVSSFWEITI